MPSRAAAARYSGQMTFLKSRWTRAGLFALMALAVVFLLVWNGPNWGQVGGAFAHVHWLWVAAAVGLNLLSVLVRALSWKTVIDQSLEGPKPGFPKVFSAFAVGLGANAILPGRIGELARVWVLDRKLKGRTGATLVGTVIAHRAFDIVPALLLVGYVLLTARIPAWALSSLGVVFGVGILLFLAALLSARRQGQGLASLEELGRLRRIALLLRRGLGVMRVPSRAVLAGVFQTLGWLCQLLAVYAAMRAFAIEAPLPAAGLVLVLINVATIFPLWPGNVGLVQAAIALPLRRYGIPYSHGFAFGVGLQAIEASVGLGVGLLFLAREGLSLASLRALQAEETDVLENP
jgi:uncharacterized protein (TIRG00374 family)